MGRTGKTRAGMGSKQLKAKVFFNNTELAFLANVMNWVNQTGPPAGLELEGYILLGLYRERYDTWELIDRKERRMNLKMSEIIALKRIIGSMALHYPPAAVLRDGIYDKLNRINQCP